MKLEIFNTVAMVAGYTAIVGGGIALLIESAIRLKKRLLRFKVSMIKTDDLVVLRTIIDSELGRRKNK